MSHILVVEDEVVLRCELKRALERVGHRVQEAADVPSALRLGPSSFDLVLSDIRLPGASGESLLPHLAGTPLVLMTAFGSVRSAVHAIKGGAVDYLSKPFEPEELIQAVQRAFDERDRAQQIKRSVRMDREGRPLVGKSPPMLAVKRQLTKVAPTDATVLLLGESGTGKELAARAIHGASPRAASAFVPVNCASIPEGLIESELFGHEKGSFTGAVSDSPGLVRAAHQGTLFLDEVGELSLPAQARLLRMLQESEVRKVGAQRAVRVDVRVVAATHQDLAEMVKRRTFRQDLYYRLRVFEIRLPPLRERGRDVVLLAEQLLGRLAARMGRRPPALGADAVQALLQAPFPGNVRELENALQRALILHEHGPIDDSLLGLSEVQPRRTAQDLAADPSLDGYFRRYVLAHEGHLSETELAERLGLSRKGLWEKRQRMGLPRRAKAGGHLK